MKNLLYIFVLCAIIFNACNTNNYNSLIIENSKDTISIVDSSVIPIDTTPKDTDSIDSIKSKAYVYLEYENDDFIFYSNRDKVIFYKDYILFSYYIKHNDTTLEMHERDNYWVCYDIFNESDDTLYFDYDNSNVGSCYNENNTFIPYLSGRISIDTVPPEFVVIPPHDSLFSRNAYEISFEEYAVGVEPDIFYYQAPTKYRHLEINDTIFTICYKPDIKLWFKIIE